MGRISEEDIRRVREATDVVALVSQQVMLRQKGAVFWGNCPFHGEKTPSFKVDPGNQRFHCFGCGADGDAFGYLMRTQNLDFIESVRALAERANIEIVEEDGPAGPGREFKTRLNAACAAAAEYYHRVLTTEHTPESESARAYLAKRGFGSEVAKRFEIGFAPGRGRLVTHLKEQGFSAEELISANLALAGDRGLRDRFFNRVIFPIRDLKGNVCGFGGRVLDASEPKYLNTQETPIFHKKENLYAIDRAKSAIVMTGTAVVVEGYTDVIALHVAGVENVIATLGTALTQEHVRLLGRFAKRVVYLFDGDAAGLRAAEKAIEFVDWTATPEAGRRRVDLYVAVIPGGMDPADFVSGQGSEAVAELIEAAVPLIRFSLERRIATHDLSTTEDRRAALAECAQVLALVKDSVIVHDYAVFVADTLRFPYEDVLGAVTRGRPVRHAAGESRTAADAVEAAPARVDSDVRLEHELIVVLAGMPPMRPGARFLLSDEALLSPEGRAALGAVLDAGDEVGDSVAERVSVVLSDAPADLISRIKAATMPADEESRDLACASLLEMGRKLKERVLLGAIRAGRARLASIDERLDARTYDAVFQETGVLQQRLQALRTSMTDEDLEAWAKSGR